MKSIIILLTVLSFYGLVDCRKSCIPRTGKNTIYCVCNETYCDDLDPIVKQDKGSVILFETNKKGDRFKESTLKWTSSNASNNALILTIDRSKTYQKIIGFGGAFTDASGLNLNTLSTDLAANVIKDYFSENGIEYTMSRIPMAGCDFSTHAYTYCDHPNDDNLTMFKLQPEDIDYKIPYIKQAVKVSPHKVKLFASPWSSPAWMKTNNKLNNGGQLIGKPGEKYYKIWANYFVKFLDAYKSNGINFWGLTVENEPYTGFDSNYRFNCLGLTKELERDFVKLDLGPALAKAGYGRDKLNVMIYDDSRDHPMIEWADACFHDNDSAQYLNGIAYHCYANEGTPWDILDKVHAAHPSQFVLSTECCQDFRILPKNTPMRLGFWDNSEKYAIDVMLNLQHWVTGYVEWNYALDLYGQPNWAQFSSESPILINATAKEYYKDPKFYVLGHFSKFLIPDSVRISLEMKDMGKNFTAIAFSRPDNATVIIAYNLNDKPMDFVLKDPQSGNLLVSIAQNSIQSYIYWN